MKQGYNKRTGSLVVGTLEVVQGKCGIEGFRNDGTFEHDGNGTDLYWDTAETVVKDGKVVFVDDSGDELTLDEITFEPPDEEYLSKAAPDPVHEATDLLQSIMDQPGQPVDCKRIGEVLAALREIA
jgi:hypothetical protein